MHSQIKSLFYTLCLHLTLLPVSTFSQQTTLDNHLTYKAITVDDGLSNNRTLAFAQDNQGYIWIGTPNGLNKYDGNQITQYYSNPNDSLTPYSNDFRTLFCDHSGKLWIGSDHVQYYDDKFNVFRTIFKNKINDPICIKEDAKKNLWILCRRDDLFRYGLETGELEHFDIGKDTPKSLGALSYKELFIDSKGNIWIGTGEGGPIILNPKSKVTKYFLNEEDVKTTFTGTNVCEIYEDRYKNIWIGTFNNGISLFHWEDSSFTHFNLDPGNEFSKRVRAIFEDSEGTLYFGTRAGLYALIPGEQTFAHVSHTEHAFSELSHNSIQEAFLDATGGLWLGTFAGGANYADMNRKPFTNYKYRPSNNNFLNDKIIYSIHEDKKGNLWIGTEQKGLTFRDAETGKFSYFPHTEDPNTPSYNDIKTIIEDEAGNLWLGTYSGGVDCYNLETKKFTHYKNNSKDSTSLVHNRVFDLFFDKSENLWVGTYGGLSIMYKGTNHFVNYWQKNKTKYRIFTREIHTIYEDKKGNIWANGSMFNPKDSTFTKMLPDTLSENYVNSIIDDNTGNYWFGLSKGLLRYNPNTDKAQLYSTKNGFPTDYICGILDDDQGNLWISSLNGLIKFTNAINEPDALKIKIFTVADGIQSKQFNYGSYYKNKEGRMYFGTINGITSFFPKEIKDNRLLSAPNINSLKVYNKAINIGDTILGKVLLTKALEHTQQITFNHKHSSFSLGFSGTHYAQPERCQFAYRLKGFDNTWNYTVKSQRSAHYTNLPAGDYLFEVKASNPDGLWNPKPAQIAITMLPPFWNTWWFRSISIAILLGSAIGFYLVRINSIKKQNEKLERLVDARTSELNQANVALEERQEEVIQQNSEIQEQARLLVENNKELELKNEYVRGSIRYAKSIQKAILPIKERIDLAFDTFIIYQPKDIVSGDFYWYTVEELENGEEIHFIAVVDCTGHGVPGAFMSMIGISLLNEIVKVSNIYDPAAILTELNLRIQKALKQQRTRNDDGMDVCLCAIQRKAGKAEVTFAGAKNGLFVFTQDDSKLVKISGSRKSIGGHHRNTEKMPFKNNSLVLQKGDIIYLASDGFVDQNGPDRQRFGTKRLINLLETIGHKPMSIQEAGLSEALLEYQSDSKQRDDITMIGVKF